MEHAGVPIIFTLIFPWHESAMRSSARREEIDSQAEH